MTRTRILVGAVLPAVLLVTAATSGTAWADSGRVGSHTAAHLQPLALPRHTGSPGDPDGADSDGADSDGADSAGSGSDESTGSARSGGGRGGAAGYNSTSCPLELGFGRGPRHCGSPTARDGAAGAGHENR